MLDMRSAALPAIHPVGVLSPVHQADGGDKGLPRVDEEWVLAAEGLCLEHVAFEPAFVLM